MDNKIYMIVRQYENPSRRRRVMRRDLTLKQAQQHCQDPETSSMTAAAGRGCHGNQVLIDKWHENQKHWFDGFVEQ